MALFISKNWLNEFVESPLSTEDLSERLTLAGLEIEGIERIGAQWPDELVVAEVTQVDEHPNADKLTILQVQTGHAEPSVVVSGAPNLKPFLGQSSFAPLKVALAMPGASLPAPDGSEDAFVIKPVKLRGVDSYGMLCSEKELGLSDNHDGILLLPEDAPVGMPLKQYLGDEVLEISIKGGFSYLLSVHGIAREVSALTKTPLKTEILNQASVSHEVSAQPPFVKLSIENPEQCRRYSSILVKGIQVQPSPFWMQQRLLSVGMRPINNIVDITNYVMLELGQPLHAFDYQFLQNRSTTGTPHIQVRTAKPNETLKTLDGIDRELDEQMLLIADDAGAIAIAGVMGGEESEVMDHTTDVLIEAANFEFLNNRRTSHMLKLHTEAAERFGKQLDPELTMMAATRAAQLMQQYAGGRIEPVVGDLYPSAPETRSIFLDPTDVTRLLGIQISPESISDILKSLEFQVAATETGLEVQVPSYRLDVNIAPDLIEEVARVYGYDRMPSTLMDDELPTHLPQPEVQQMEQLRDLLVAEGFHEVITYSLVDPHEEAKLEGHPEADLNQYVPLKNPLVHDRSHMRRSLLPGMLQTAKHNIHKQESVLIFEMGAVFHPQTNQVLPEEPQRLSMLMMGKEHPTSWHATQVGNYDFYDLKGVLENIMKALNIHNVNYVASSQHTAYHPGRCAEVQINGNAIGYLGELHPRLQKEYEVTQAPVLLLELDVQPILENSTFAYSMKPISTFTPIYEDLAFVVNESTPASHIAAAIWKAGQPLMTELKLFDVFRGERVGEGKKSLAYAMSYQSLDRTLTDEDVAPVRQQIIQTLEQEHQALLRS